MKQKLKLFIKILFKRYYFVSAFLTTQDNQFGFGSSYFECWFWEIKNPAMLETSILRERSQVTGVNLISIKRIWWFDLDRVTKERELILKIMKPK